jgi:hypothetical protein
VSDPLAIFRDPPRRLSVSDEGFEPELGQSIEIWLDGYKQDRVLAYDCQAGTIERMKVEGFGDPIIDGDQFVTETVSGRVLVRWKQRP